jgi:hypothetical protein
MCTFQSFNALTDIFQETSSHNKHHKQMVSKLASHYAFSLSVRVNIRSLQWSYPNNLQTTYVQTQTHHLTCTSAFQCSSHPFMRPFLLPLSLLSWKAALLLHFLYRHQISSLTSLLSIHPKYFLKAAFSSYLYYWSINPSCHKPH